MSVCPRAEILQMEPSIAVLKLMHLDVIDNVENFHWLEAPSKESIRVAIRRLQWLKAIDPTSNRLTKIGQQMAQLGLSPMLSAMLLSAVGKTCINYVLVLAGMLNVSDSVWWRSKDPDARERGRKTRMYFSQDNQQGGDFIMLLKIFLHWQAIEPKNRMGWCLKSTISAKALKIGSEFANDIARQLRVDLPKFDKTTLDGNLIKEIMNCVKVGFFQNMGVLFGSVRDGYRLSSNVQGQSGINAKIYNLSSLFSNKPPPTFVLYHTILNLQHISCMVTLCPIQRNEIPNEWLDYYLGKPMNTCPKPENIVSQTSIPKTIPDSKNASRPVVTHEEQNNPTKSKASEKAEKCNITSKSSTASKVDNESSLGNTGIFDTIEVVRKGSYFVGNKQIQIDSKQLKTIVYNHTSKLYHSVKKPLSDFNVFPFSSTNVRVVNKDRLVVYKELVSQGRRPVLLNMACPTSPGGKYLESVATQEAILFRRSNYFLSLDATLDYVLPTNRFCYDSNCQLQPLFKEQKVYPIDEFGGIYTSGLTIFRQSDEEGYAFMEQPLLNVCFIAMAAHRNPPLNNDGYLSDEHSIALRKKIENLFFIAYHQGHDCLVLSAFGCGNFRNPPKHVAAIFHSVIEQYAGFFKQIEFAIIDGHNSQQHANPNENYETFKRLLDNIKVEPLRQTIPDTVIGPWRIRKTTERNIHLAGVEIYSGSLCPNGGECMNLHNIEHCKIFSHPPQCPFSVDAKTCQRKTNHNHLVWFKHEFRDTHDMKSPLNDNSRLSRPIDRDFSSNQQRFHSYDRLRPAYTASLWSEDRSPIRPTIDWMRHTDAAQTERPRYETNSILFTRTRTDHSISRLFNRENHDTRTSQFSVPPYESIPIDDTQPHRRLSHFHINTLDDETNAVRPSTTSKLFRKPTD